MIQRLLALAQKEFIQIRRDRRTLAMMIVLPLLWLVMFGYAFSFDVKEITVAVVDQSGTKVGALVADAFRQYERFRMVSLADPTDAGIRAGMARDQVQMGIIIPAGFGEGTGGNNPELQVLIDGSDLFAAQAGARLLQKAMEPAQDQIKAEVEARIKSELRLRVEREMEKLAAEARAKAEAEIASRAEKMRADIQRQITGEIERRKAALLSQVPPNLRAQVEKQLLGSLTPPELPAFQLELPADLIKPPSVDELDLTPPAAPQLAPQLEILYNPDLKSANVMIPGLLGLVIIFMTIMMTAVGIVREREYGTMEQLVVTPLRPIELMLGKLLPYFLVAAFDFALVFIAGTYLFDLTFAGNLPIFLALSLLLVFTSLGLGLLLSTVAQNQQQAMQMAIFVILPQILLSGLIFPLSSLPKAIQYVAYLLPFTHFVPIARGMFIKGQGLELLTTPALVLAAYAVGVVVLASLRFRKRLG